MAGDFGADAISRAYYAAFCAAEACLLSLGETRSKHSGVVSAFAELVVHRGGLDPATGQRLRSLFERRNQADYGTAPVTNESAAAAVDDAERFVEAAASWLRQRSADPASSHASGASRDR